MKYSLKNHSLLSYIIKFIGVFCICYFGTIAVIGLSAPGGYYSAFIHNYFDYVTLLRKSLMHGSATLLSLLGYHAVISNVYLKIENGREVQMGFDCLGYGVMSFWIAFIVANKGTWLKKLKWIFGGLFLIWLINVARISMLLLSINNHWAFPFFDHHTWFNIFAYLLIFILIYFYDKSGKMKSTMTDTKTTAFKVTDK